MEIPTFEQLSVLLLPSLSLTYDSVYLSQSLLKCRQFLQMDSDTAPTHSVLHTAHQYPRQQSQFKIECGKMVPSLIKDINGKETVSNREGKRGNRENEI
jgi:hypothetical protein